MPKRMSHEAARQRVQEIKGLYVHAAIYAVVILTLFVVDVATGSPFWVHWVALGWGAGLGGHYALVNGSSSDAVQAWEERKMRELTGTQTSTGTQTKDVSDAAPQN